MKRIIYTTACLLFSLMAMAQNDVQYTQYMFNRMDFNPAYVGSTGTPEINAIYRDQWTGNFADGKAPRTGTINWNTPIQCGRGGVGLGFTSDKAGIFTSNRLNGAYAYKFPVSEKGKISLGLGAQLEFGRADFRLTNPLDPGDQTIFNAGEEDSQTKINFGAGVYYTHDDRFYIGLSVPQLLNTSFFREVDISGDGNDFHTYFLMAGFVADLSDNIKLVPGTLVSFQGRNAPFEWNLNANLVFVEKLWLGLNYRLGDSIDGLVQYQITDQLKAGFAYDFTTSDIQDVTNGSLEFLLNYNFTNFSNKISNVRYF